MSHSHFFFYHSPQAKKSVVRVLLALVLVMLSGYGLLFFQIKQTQILQTKALIEDVAEALNHEISEHGEAFSEALDKPKMKGVNYQFIVFSPTGKTSVVTSQDSTEKIHLPNWKLAQANQDAIIIHGNSYEVWRQLDDGYTIYGIIVAPSILPYFLHPVYLIPLAITLVVFLVFLSYLSQYHRAWRELIGYSQNLQRYTTQDYQPLKLTYPNASLEIAQINQAVNRVGYQLHQYVKKIHQLTYRQQLLVDSAPAALFLLSRSGQITYFNQSFAQLFKTPYHATATYRLSDFITGVDKNAQQILNDLLAFNYAQTLSVTDLPRNQYFDLRLNPTYNQFGQLRGYSGSLEVVNTYHMQLQQAWLNSKQQQEKLAQFTKLWAVLGHELRTPLSGIIGMVALLNEEKASLSPEQQDLLTNLTESSSNMLQLLNDMLDMAKLDAGKLQTNLSNTDLLKLCRGVCGIMASNARRQNIELLYHTNPLIPRFLLTDESRLRQILLNLINNAIKFTKEGYVALLVDLAQKDDPIILAKAYTNQTAQTWLKITIKDTGIGIEQQEQQKLFAYFNQANDSISQQFGGTGIGLALSNNFTQMLGGFIHLTSQIGEGSEFQVYLPLPDYQPRLVFPFNTAPYPIEIFYFTAYAISAPYVTSILAEVGIAATVHTGISENMVETINALPVSTLMPVFLVDDLCFKDNQALFYKIHRFESSSKILFSMQSQQHISPNILSQFDGFILKPLYISNFMGELSRVIEQKSINLLPNNPISAQMAFEKFLQKYHHKTLSSPSSDEFLEAHVQIASAPATPSERVSPPFAQKSILLVEDNAVNQKIAHKQLEKMGYSVILAENGQEAIQQLQDHRHSLALILMDCQMPIMDGLEATRRIRAAHDSIPIVALTANESEVERERCLEAGMDNFLTKPLNKQALQKILTRYMI